MTARVLIVDDDPAIRRAIGTVLARDGFDVTTACDAGPALEQVAASRPDIVIVDYNMPTCGLEVVRELKGSCGDSMFVAVLTGDDHEDLRADCLAAGADAVLIKPIALTELRRRLTAAALALKTVLAAS